MATFRTLTAFLARQWFLVALAVALTIGFLLPGGVLRLGELPGLKTGLVASVLFLMGLTVPARSFGVSFRAPQAGLLALLLNVVAVPAVAFPMALMLPPNLGGGLIVAAAVPCTLASALAWTRKGRGNEVIPMMVMLITNSLCFLIAPATLMLLIGQQVAIDFGDQASKLATVVVLPMAVAAVLRLVPGVGPACDWHKQSITRVALIGILVMVSIGAAETARRGGSLGAEDSGIQTSLWIVLVGGLALTVHLVVLGLGWWLSGRLGMSRPDRVGVAIAGSQKTLMVGLQISIDCGVSTLPMTLYHVAQLLADTVFADRVSRGAGPEPSHTPEPSHPVGDGRESGEASAISPEVHPGPGTHPSPNR